MNFKKIALMGALLVGLSSGVQDAGAEDNPFHTFVDTLFDERAEITLYMPSQQRAELEPLALECFEHLKRFEKAIKDPGTADAEIQKALAERVETAKRIAASSGGKLALNTQPLRDLWLDAAVKGVPPAEELIRGALDETNNKKTDLGESGAAFVWSEPNPKGMDFVPFREGLLVDEAGTFLKERGYDFFLLGVGSVWKASVKSAGSGYWTVPIEHPRLPEKFVSEARFQNGCLATVGDYHDFFMHEGKRYSEVLDVQTGKPAQSGVVSATAWAPSALEAQLLAYLLMASGPETGFALLSSNYPKNDALVVLEDSLGKLSVAGSEGLQSRVEDISL